MSLEKVVKVDLVEIVESGVVQVRTKTAIIENGKQISSSFHRHLVEPGADFSKEDPKVKAICAAVHTPDVVAAWQAAKAAK
jgi:hypothetical protein